MISGIRRCGKTVLLFELFCDYLHEIWVDDDHIIKIELDQRKYHKFRNHITLCEYMESSVQARKDEKFFLFINEVQFTMKIVGMVNEDIEVTIYDSDRLSSWKIELF